MDTPLIPGLADPITAGLFALGTGLFVFAMWNFRRQLKQRKDKSKIQDNPKAPGDNIEEPKT